MSKSVLRFELGDIYWYVGADTTPRKEVFLSYDNVKFVRLLKARNVFISEVEAAEMARKLRNVFLSYENFTRALEASLYPRSLDATVFSRPDCPDWAKYAAVNKSGIAWFFEFEPTLIEDEMWIRTEGQTCIIADCFFSNLDWRSSLVKRPGGAVSEIEMSMLLERKDRRIQELEKLLLDKNISTLDPQKEKLFALLLIELEKAEQKHPEFPGGFSEASAIVTEEYLELIRAINDNENVDRVVEEASHVAVTALRLIGTVLAE